MIVNWNAMSYLTAIKDYRGILCSFLAAIALAFGLGSCWWCCWAVRCWRECSLL